ncbi:MAG: cell division protein ZapA [Oscillospiraceae bacterium]|nr:cell division protein ZapA [Oscillospiraceae bacterium]
MPDNKIVLKIADISIPVCTTEDEAYTVALAEDIDADMRQILDSNASASVTSAALLCAIDYLDSFRKANRSTNNLRNQIKEYLADAANAKLQYDEECKKSGELTVELNAMRQHLTRIAAEGDTTGAVEQLKAQLAGATGEINRCKKQNGELMMQINALADKSNAMNEYISGQDKEIARLSALVNIHLETIASLEEKLRAKQTPAVETAQSVEQAQSDIQSVLNSMQANREAAEKLAPAIAQTAPAPAVEQTTLENAPDETKIGEPVFFTPEDKGEEKAPDEPEIVEDLETAESADPIKKLEEEISSFPFDIDIDDKPEEFFRGEYAVRDRERAEEQARLEKAEHEKTKAALKKDEDLPDLDWTRDL